MSWLHEQRQDKLEDLLEEFHIQHIRTSNGMALSGGDAVVEIARAIGSQSSVYSIGWTVCWCWPNLGWYQENHCSLVDRGLGVLMITDYNVRETLTCVKKLTLWVKDTWLQRHLKMFSITNSFKQVYSGEQFVYDYIESIESS